jgi:hypothetical protein
MTNNIVKPDEALSGFGMLEVICTSGGEAFYVSVLCTGDRRVALRF